MAESSRAAPMFLRTASSRPERCLCPSLSIDCIPYDGPALMPTIVGGGESEWWRRERRRRSGGGRSEARRIGKTLVVAAVFMEEGSGAGSKEAKP
jgi:hypothetical protein